jgi:hypothetical protein
MWMLCVLPMRLHTASSLQPKTVTPYPLQQIQLLALRGRCRLPPWRQS